MEDKFAALRTVYHDKVYAKSNVLDGQFRGICAMYRELYGRFMPADKTASIVDIGCGPGQFLKFCLKTGYNNILGIDLSDGQVQYAHDHITKKVIKGDGLTFLGAHPNTFDLVVANDLIEHLPKDRALEFVGLVKQALKPGGRILLKTGNMAAFGGLVMWCNALDHECGYTERSLSVLLEVWDFQNVQIIPCYGGYAPGRLLQRLSYRVLGLLYKYIYGGHYPKIYTKLIGVVGTKE